VSTVNIIIIVVALIALIAIIGMGRAGPRVTEINREVVRRDENDDA
jgi:uncharacterized membrane protein